MRKGFTLTELLVVIGMIAVLMGAMTTSVTAARHRSRMQKATAEVKIISQAILAYENFADDHKLPTMNRKEAGKDSLPFLFGEGSGTGAADGQKHQLPTLLLASLSAGGQILDPWGHPYLVTIREGGSQLKVKTVTGALNTGYWLPNFYRVSEGEK